MARLPQPGADQGVWGNVLNEFLNVSHNNDGTVKAGAVDAAALQDNAVSGTKLQDSSVSDVKLDTSNLPVNGQVLSFNGSGLAWANGGAGGDPAMGGDLSGVASNAQIVANAVGSTELATNAVTTGKIADANVTDAKIASGVAQSKITNLTTDLAGKVNTTTTVSAGTGLTGGGDLSTNRTLSANFGTTGGTIAEGNDSRIVGAEQTVNKGAANGYAGLNSSSVVPVAQLGSGTANTTTYLRGDGTWATAAEPVGIVSLTDAATIATDASAGKHFRVSIAADRTLGVPTNPSDGMRRIWEVTASGANRNLTLSTGTAGSFELTTNITSPITIANGKTQFIGAIYNAGRARWTVLASQATS